MTVLNENYTSIALIKLLSPFRISIMLSQFSRKYPNRVDDFIQCITKKALSSNSHLFA